MKNKLKNSCLLLLVLLFFSCKSNTHTDCVIFPLEKDISVKQIKDLNDYSSLINPTKLVLKNNYLYVGSSRTDTCFFVLNVPDLNLIYSFGYRGPGPYEYKFAIIHDSQRQNRLFFSGFSNLLLFREYEILSEQELVEVSEFRLGVGGVINDAYFVNDSILIYNDIYNWNLPIVNYRKDLIVDYIYHPEKDLAHDGTNHINSGSLASNGTCFIYVYENKPQIDIYDSAFNLVRSILKEYTPLAYRYGTKDEKSYYGSVFAGKKYLYCLYSGLSAATNLDNKHQLEVYNYEGKPIIKYNISEEIPVGFVVDEENYCLYGFSSVESGILYVYELEGLK